MNWRRKTGRPGPDIIGLLLFLFSTLAMSAAASGQPAPGLGRYYALVIGNRHYQHLEEVPSAEADAKEVARLLEERYGFETELLLDAGRDQIMRTLTRLPERVSGEQDNLLLYYAGHGNFDKKSGAGYWLPADAQPGRSEGWIPAAMVSSILKTVGVGHVLIASGSCYSGNLFAQERGGRKLRELAETPSFTVLTAGCVEPLRESGAGHSLFAWTLLRTLHGNQNVLPASTLSGWLKQGMSQPLEYGSLSTQAQGDFLFVPKSVQERIRAEQEAKAAPPLPSAPSPAADEMQGPAFDPAAVQPQPGDVMINRLTGMELVYMPGGCFTMGASAKELSRFVWELPAHEVCVDGFWMGRHEVTQAEWQAVMGGNPSGHQAGGSHPVENVSWDEIQTFLSRLNSSMGRRYRLPTEAEWEYACRAGGTGLYCGGDDIDSIAWHEGNSGGRTHAAGELRANAFGLHDMSGNVWEWCSDLFDHNYYKVSIRYNPQGPAKGDKRVVRGGSLGSKAQNCRAAFRFRNMPDYREDWLGFRVVLQQ
jgi:formylglycine-generating enzyme required for sulfatase activity